uniref:Uncharacterized protein n=1 Tax=Pinctada fucata TaxID=50426 RepID=A0A194ANX0_PINFU
MKILLVCVAIAVSEAFLFSDDCKSDADCASGCCVPGTFAKHCATRFLSYLNKCHLSGKELGNCGCSPGLHCEKAENIAGVAVEYDPSFVYGLCEHGVSNSTGSPLGVAVEGGR